MSEPQGDPNSTHAEKRRDNEGVANSEWAKQQEEERRGPHPERRRRDK